MRAAQCYLGFCYQIGQGVPQEYGEAAKWFREAAEQATPRHSLTSASFMKPARASLKISPKPSSGIMKRPSKENHRHNLISVFFYEIGQVVPQNFEEAVNGTGWPRTRNVLQPNAISVSVTKSGGEYLKICGRLCAGFVAPLARETRPLNII